MQQTIHVYEAIKQMQALTTAGKSFSFAFYKYDRKRKSGGDLARISRAALRKKTADTRIEHSSYKLFFTDLDSGRALSCWQMLIVEFNGKKCFL